MPSEYLDKVRSAEQDVNALFKTLGIQVIEISPQRAVLRIDTARRHTQGAGVTGGGVLATLADEAMAHAVLANLEPGQKTATVELSMRFFKAVPENTPVTATATILHKGRRIITVQAKITTANNSLAAQSTASFMVL
ncbi:MAG: PaaI family thioesterase [Desulfovibrionaceae bacterium]|jgi:uncharacterized protein (TIGR00369 family)|nr:PaaI family thioesterase [Desulfovibrionaceae bacterium]